MTATMQRKHSVVEFPGDAGEALDREDPEFPDTEYNPNPPWIDDQAIETCSAIGTPAPPPSPPARMLVKRSLSPDGRIDSISVEIELGIEDLSPLEIRNRGLRALKLGDEIAHGHLTESTSAALPTPVAKPQPERHNGLANGNARSAPAKLMDIGRTKNNNYFINVQVNGKIAKLFGSRQRLVAELARAGQPLTPEAISEGLRLNFFCRAVTEPSNDGRFLNVVQLFPSE